MTSMNETSTITLPEYHNLLAFLLLSLNTPSVSSSSTTQEEEMIKKREEERILTQNQVQDSRTEQVVKYQIQTKRQTSHTRYTIKKRQVSHQKKERQTKPVYHHEHANTNHTPERRITPTITQPSQNPKTKKKNHTTHSRLTNHSTPRLQPTQTHIQSSCSSPISALPSSSSPQLPTLLTTPC